MYRDIEGRLKSETRQSEKNRPNHCICSFKPWYSRCSSNVENWLCLSISILPWLPLCSVWMSNWDTSEYPLLCFIQPVRCNSIHIGFFRYLWSDFREGLLRMELPLRNIARFVESGESRTQRYNNKSLVSEVYSVVSCLDRRLVDG